MRSPASHPYDAATGSPVGPVTSTGTRENPQATTASTVPSPPSATGSSTVSAAPRSPAATRAATSGAVSDPLNLSGATTTCPLIGHLALHAVVRENARK
jgi:hypothetical protein